MSTKNFTLPRYLLSKHNQNQENFQQITSFNVLWFRTISPRHQFAIGTKEKYKFLSSQLLLSMSIIRRELEVLLRLPRLLTAL